MKVSETKEGAIIEVFVRPNSPKFEVAIDDGEIVVFCTEEPVKGKVNKELVKEFSKRFHAKAEIISGLTSKQKRLLITGVRKSEAEQFLRAKRFFSCHAF
jgi:uncharacterized protein (TIGR00251 family)